MSENAYRISTAIIVLVAVGVSSYFRKKADQDTGERLSREVDGTVLMRLIQAGGLLLWLGPLVYLLNPSWMSWSKIGLAGEVRWLGLAIGVFCVTGIFWLFISIGNGITPTSATRQRHTLVTHGPYRWVRHPLYTLGATLFVALGMIADSWFMALIGILAFILMAIRTPKEEANLIAKFGDDYRMYMKDTGRFLPKLR